MTRTSSGSSSPIGPPGARDRIPAAGLFILIGTETRTGWLPPRSSATTTASSSPATPSTAHDGRSTRPPQALETSVPGVFAAGDVRANDVKRVAAAVGEGSINVPMVHRFLEERAPAASGSVRSWPRGTRLVGTRGEEALISARDREHGGLERSRHERLARPLLVRGVRRRSRQGCFVCGAVPSSSLDRARRGCGDEKI